MPTQANIYIDQGTDYETSVEVVNDDGLPVDLVGAVLKAQARKVYSTKTVFEFDILTADASQGTFLLYLSAENNNDLKPGKYKYDVLITVGGSTVKLIEGLVFIVETVTVA